MNSWKEVESTIPNEYRFDDGGKLKSFSEHMRGLVNVAFERGRQMGKQEAQERMLKFAEWYEAQGAHIQASFPGRGCARLFPNVEAAFKHWEKMNP